jgi:nucleotide-binding universal stress UspA family protein
MTTILSKPAPKSGSAASPIVILRNPARRGPVLLAMDGVDGIDDAAKASTAKSLALRLDVPCRVVSVIEPWPMYAGAPAMWPVPPLPLAAGEFVRAREGSVRRRLSATFGEDCRLDIRIGRTAREIRELAREVDASLVVMGAAPHRLLGHVVSGGRSAQVLRGAPCPVLSVAPTLEGLPRRVVAAVDFSPASIRALQAALLVMDPEATVTLVHVALARELTRAPESAALPDEQTTLRFERLRQRLAPYAPARVRFDMRVLSGAVVPELLGVAESLGADLIVAGTHGPAFIERMFLGSTATNLLHLASCSVLVAPAPRGAEAMDLELAMFGAATTTDANEWGAVLDALSRRNSGRRVTLEVDDPDFGAQIEVTGYVLRGLAFDAHDRRVEVMVAAPQEGGGHLTRTIAHVDAIAVVSGTDGSDRALAIRHGRGQTILFIAA